MEEEKRSSRTRILGIGIVHNLKALGMVRGTQDRHSPREAMEYFNTITRYSEYNRINGICVIECIASDPSTSIPSSSSFFSLSHSFPRQRQRHGSF